MELAVPDSHVLFGLGQDSYSSIAGSLSIFSAVDQEVKMEFVRYFCPKSSTLPSLKKGSRLVSLSMKRKSLAAPALPSTMQTPNAQAETLVRCTLWTHPNATDEERSRRRLNFSLPLPSDIPVTAETSLGTISYAIIATASSPTATLQVSRTVRILRLVRPDPILHARSYPGDKVVTELWVTPKGEQIPGNKDKASYSLRWLARSTIRRGARACEVKYIVAKELRWTIDETVSLAQSRESRRQGTVLKQYKRRIGRGRENGRWVATGGIGEGNDTIEIPFEVHIQDAVDTMSFWDRLSTDRLTVEHRLHLEVITGEDTFDQKTGNLVDRRTPVKSYNAVFALSVHDYSSVETIAIDLPKYDDLHPVLPVYTTHPDARQLTL